MATLYLNSTIVGVCSTPGAVRKVPGDPVSSKCPECELDIINETGENRTWQENKEGS